MHEQLDIVPKNTVFNARDEGHIELLFLPGNHQANLICLYQRSLTPRINPQKYPSRVLFIHAVKHCLDLLSRLFIAFSDLNVMDLLVLSPLPEDRLHPLLEN